MMIKLNAKIRTNGCGYWSRRVANVRINKMHCWAYDDQSGELRVFFDKRTWQVNQHGLIYTDPLFIQELNQYLTSLGYDVSDLSYSEQGMQGVNYVSFDCGAKFMGSLQTKKVQVSVDSELF